MGLPWVGLVAADHGPHIQAFFLHSTTPAENGEMGKIWNVSHPGPPQQLALPSCDFGDRHQEPL